MKHPKFFTPEGNITLERRAKIIEILENRGQVRVDDLSEFFGVSEVTIRNDFDKLEEKGLLIRTRGGGIKNQRVRIDYQLNREATHRLKEKQLIGRKAATLVKERDTILFDSGTTTLEVAKNLTATRDLTVITNALNIASHFMNDTNVNVIMLGGRLRYSTISLIGPIAEDAMRNLYCDKVFLGVNGIDSKYGISTTHVEDSHLNKMMMNTSKEIIVVTDSSKFLRRSFSLIAPISAVDTVVTDSAIPETELHNLQKAGVQVIIAEDA
jgi:DeoR family transcriptional regulator, aga operon transcriptional repressor